MYSLSHRRQGSLAVVLLIKQAIQNKRQLREAVGNRVVEDQTTVQLRERMGMSILGTHTHHPERRFGGYLAVRGRREVGCRA